MFAARFFPGSPHPSVTQPAGGDARGRKARDGRGRRSCAAAEEERADPPSPAPARDWPLPVGCAAQRCTAAPPCGAEAPTQADGEGRRPRPRRPAAAAGAAAGASRTRESGCFGGYLSLRPSDELPPGVHPLKAPQAAARASGSSLPGFVPCDCEGSEVCANGDNASVYPRSPGNPKGGSPRNSAALHAGALAVPAPGLPRDGARSCSGPEPEREPRGSPAGTGRPGPEVAPGPRARCPPAARPFPGDEKFRPCPPLLRRELPAEPRAAPALPGRGLPAAAVSLLVLRRSPLPARALTK